jgi:hypothetical protein
MKHALAASIAILITMLVQPATAQDDGPPVPIEKAPYHLPAFTNEYITLLNVTVPPGKNTGYHTHSNDSVSVNVGAAHMANQNFGDKEQGPVRLSRRGEASYTGYNKLGPRTHKASNMGSTPFHNISFIFRYPQPGRFTPGARSEGYTQILDNERVRGWRLVLDPGQSAPAITQSAPGLRIVLDGGEIAEAVPGARDRGMLLKHADVFWQDAGVTRAVRNIGTTRVEFLEFELK